MSLLSILAVAICAKPELSLRGVKVRALLTGAVEQTEPEGCRMLWWRGCWGDTWEGWRVGGIGDGEVTCLAAQNLGDHSTGHLMDIKTKLQLHSLLLS